MENNVIQKMSIDEFRKFGLLFYTNILLQPLGVSIVAELDKDGKAIALYPVRSKFRGFDEDSQDRNYPRIAEYLKENIDYITNIAPLTLKEKEKEECLK